MTNIVVLSALGNMLSTIGIAVVGIVVFIFLYILRKYEERLAEEA